MYSYQIVELWTKRHTPHTSLTYEETNNQVTSCASRTTHISLEAASRAEKMCN